ncbi:NAD(P)H-binding protein [Pseudobdellovibrio exovorus]|uniref:NAD(P)-binding domain-containing protein n=1 Tax=Pseudobdellovibrio exovorus JSS TaxID=1184267 RepID=M4V8G7_9BACT|nr:NAD(P)H-binding protein [Pseudobdellovibrio exovorus]AGH94301.1 hypothetical protein A11Q_81 [Pseudobdellovibrio exovorus JSS]
MKTAVVIGSTGLVGTHLVEKLVHEGSFAQILAIVRRHPANLADSSGVWNNPKVRCLTFDFEDWNQLEIQVRSFAGTSSLSFFCCLGTTISKAGSQQAFRKIDYEHVVNFARMARICRAEKLLVVSAIGADAKSSVFYNRVKGEMESHVTREFTAGDLHFFHPSLLLGDRQEFRFGERLAVLFSPIYSWLIAKKFRPVHAAQVAKAMVLASTGKLKASRIVENAVMLDLK